MGPGRNHPEKPTPDSFLVLDSGGSYLGLWDALLT